MTYAVSSWTIPVCSFPVLVFRCTCTARNSWRRPQSGSIDRWTPRELIYKWWVLNFYVHIEAIKNTIYRSCSRIYNGGLTTIYIYILREKTCHIPQFAGPIPVFFNWLMPSQSFLGLTPSNHACFVETVERIISTPILFMQCITDWWLQAMTIYNLEQASSRNIQKYS